MLLERLGWTYSARESLAVERGNEREVLLKGRLHRALMRLNEWLTEAQAERVIFDLEHIGETGMARNQGSPRVPDLRNAADCRRGAWPPNPGRAVFRLQTPRVRSE